MGRRSRRRLVWTRFKQSFFNGKGRKRVKVALQEAGVSGSLLAFLTSFFANLNQTQVVFQST